MTQPGNWFERAGSEFSLTAEAVERFPGRPWIIPGILMKGKVSEFRGRTRQQFKLAAALVNGPPSIGAVGKHTAFQAPKPASCFVIAPEGEHQFLSEIAKAAFIEIGSACQIAASRLRFVSAEQHPIQLLERTANGGMNETSRVDCLVRYLCAQRFDALILDPLSVMSDADEGRGQDMRRVNDVLRRIARDANVAVAAISAQKLGLPGALPDDWDA